MEIEESWEDDDWSDEYAEDDAYYDDEDDDYTVPCPECGTEVYEDVDRCPNCGEYIIHSASTRDYVWGGRPVWWVVLGVLGILGVIIALSGL